MQDNFNWSKNPQGEYFVNVTYRDDELIIAISAASHEPFLPAFEVQIQPKQREFSWSIHIHRITLCADTCSTSMFVALWKALDLELKENHLKADLVQLCGYYQYEPSIQSQLVVHSEHVSEEWALLRLVVQGIGVRKQLHVKQLAELWAVSDEQVKTHASFLKLVGFEVRNHKTNPQIEQDYYLLPYAFPTLTPLSVQLNKSLE
ncbi:MAG: hypothetical protein UHX00_01185 [Caryophanon sp.]|nr:hypothetical protein [Caryophanon sp.]